MKPGGQGESEFLNLVKEFRNVPKLFFFRPKSKNVFRHPRTT